jgi:hypothetical protein
MHDRRLRSPMAAASAAALLLLLAGCGASTQQAGSRPPASATPGVLALTATDFFDTDGNKFRDTSTIVVYIFADSAHYQLPMRAQGEFDFRLETPDGQPIGRWRFDRRQTEGARRDLAPGPGFVFELSLLQGGTDRIAAPAAELIATFIPADGEQPLHARTQSPLLVGSVGRSGGVR